MKTLFRKLGRPRLYETIVNDIAQLIVDGQLKPGDSLPPERELAEQFGVSRTAVREAVKVLAEKQLITVLPGKGAIVAPPSSSSVTASLGLLFKLGRATLTELTEVRHMIEPETAALAATRATPEDIGAIEQRVAAHREGADNPAQVASLDLAFHRSISQAAQNQVAKAMLDSVQELFLESILAAVSGIPRAFETAVRDHSQICWAIKERDAAAARQFMLEHLDHVAEQQQLSEQANQGDHSNSSGQVR